MTTVTSKPFVPISGRKITIGVVGCGRISKSHFNAIAVHSDSLELVAVCDIDEAVLRDHAERHAVPGFAKLEDMLTEAKPDLVAICTPSGLHSQQTMLSARHRVNVITEKPMATTWADAKRMVAECEKAGVRLFVVKQNRRNATLQLLHRAIDKGRFGRIYMVTVNVFWTRPQEYYDSASWRGTWELDGGAFMNQASHYVDLLTWLIGPIESVHAFTGTLARNIEVEDTGVLSVRWRSGALGSVNVTMLTYPKNMEGSITIIGEKATVRVGGVAVNEIQHWEFAEPEDGDATIAEASYKTTSVYGFGHPLYYENVIAVLRGEAEPDTDGREGLRSLETLIGAYRSARHGKRVSLPLE